MSDTQIIGWRVVWRARITGATGHGMESFPKDEAQRYADALNRDATGAYLIHTIEPVYDQPGVMDARELAARMTAEFTSDEILALGKELGARWDDERGKFVSIDPDME